MPSRIFRTLGLVFLVPLGLFATGSGSASAASPVNPSFSVSFDAGQACSSFQLDVFGTGGNVTTRHVNSTMTVIITGGTGSALTFTNDATGKSVSFPSNGVATITTTNPDKSTTLQLNGHNVIILMPSDTTPGPSTTLVVGRAVINVSSTGAFDVLSIAGRETDICALLT
jgi:hypothetical protein